MATVVDLRRLLANDPRLTCVFLCFTSSLNTDKFRLALKTNTVIEEIVISADDRFFSEFNDEEVADVFEAIGKLPRLRKLTISCYPERIGIVSIHAINSMLKYATQLMSLFVADVTILTSNHDHKQELATFAERIQTMTYLRDFHIRRCNIRPRRQLVLLDEDNCRNGEVVLSEDTDTYLEPLCSMVLPLMPCLQSIHLQAKDPGGLGHLSIPAATALCLSASVHRLELQKMNLTNDHATAMACVLQCNSRLTTLDLGTFCDLTATAAAAMGKMLSVNSTLCHLELAFGKMISDQCAEELALGLRHNRKMQTFVLKTANTIHGNSNKSTPTTPPTTSYSLHHRIQALAQDAQQIQNPLQTTTNPKQVKPKYNSAKSIGRVTPRCRKAFLGMLQYNYTLQKFFLFRKCPLSRELKLYAGLNALGRGDVMAQEGAAANSQRDWVDKLGQVNTDLTAIYYFLSNNPTLCMTPEEKKQTPVVEMKFQKKQQEQDVLSTTLCGGKRRRQSPRMPKAALVSPPTPLKKQRIV